MSIEKIKKIVKDQWTDQAFDHLAFSLIDFSKKQFYSFELIDGKEGPADKNYFDLASLTKPLTMAAYFHQYPNKLTSDNRLLLEHRAGLPSWGRLGRDDWKKQLFAYEIKESEVLYSDFSALRLMLEIEKDQNKSLQSLCSSYWDRELVYWKNLSFSESCAPTGWRNKTPIIHEVNDDNCFVLDRFCSHAGLFGTIDGLSQSLINLESQSNFIGQMNCDFKNHFNLGWDSATGKGTLAGKEASARVFGHLGFTGTSMWIDAEKKIGWALLTNVTKDFWYKRDRLNKLRHQLGGIVWQM